MPSSTPSSSKLLPFHHVLPDPASLLDLPPKTAVLYATLDSPNFRHLHSYLYSAAHARTPHLTYVFRQIPPALLNSPERAYLSGYGISLDLKKMDYLAVDLTVLGFMKIAIQHGADLVPVFSFGENDIFKQMPNQKGTSLFTPQKKFQNMFGFTLPLFHGRRLLNYNLGFMLYRRRIVAAIGNPIYVVQCDKPTLEEVMHVQQYIDELMPIWYTYNEDQFAKTRTLELNIIE
ncbi:diacylglycerol acyltransferase-domain-containing protein [Ganoderma leucocontextum]|nr:diacylglycerol acyltransferase-domain-containing protein [Ganoderma leucocontextum]